MITRDKNPNFLRHNFSSKLRIFNKRSSSRTKLSSNRFRSLDKGLGRLTQRSPRKNLPNSSFLNEISQKNISPSRALNTSRGRLHAVRTFRQARSSDRKELNMVPRMDSAQNFISRIRNKMKLKSVREGLVSNVNNFS